MDLSSLDPIVLQAESLLLMIGRADRSSARDTINGLLLEAYVTGARDMRQHVDAVGSGGYDSIPHWDGCRCSVRCRNRGQTQTEEP